MHAYSGLLLTSWDSEVNEIKIARAFIKSGGGFNDL